MKKFTTRDGRNLRVKVNSDDTSLLDLLTDTISRLSYEEILEGELDKRLGENASSVEVDLSSTVDIKDAFLSKAIFDALSKPHGI